MSAIKEALEALLQAEYIRTMTVVVAAEEAAEEAMGIEHIQSEVFIPIPYYAILIRSSLKAGKIRASEALQQAQESLTAIQGRLKQAEEMTNTAFFKLYFLDDAIKTYHIDETGKHPSMETPKVLEGEAAALGQIIRRLGGNKDEKLYFKDFITTHLEPYNGGYLVTSSLPKYFTAVLDAALEVKSNMFVGKLYKDRQGNKYTERTVSQTLSNVRKQ
jgi:hypothetical protein